jgi:predicted N-acyltransferase
MAEDYVIRVVDSLQAVSAVDWDALLSSQRSPSPFMRHAYLTALHASLSATPSTGWTPHAFLVESAGALAGAAVLYEKSHSYGEYVFDWAWAQAYAQHGLAYYPKAVVAVPFTPVPGTRLLARGNAERQALVRALVQWCQRSGMSSLHLLFGDDADTQACEQAGLMLRHGVQFHWNNTPDGYRDLDDFLQSLSQEKRKKIRQERRKVHDAGVRFRISRGNDISAQDWQFFYHCYAQTYLEHGNAPYLTPDFFSQMADTMPEHWLLFIAERNGIPIASSLLAIDPAPGGKGGVAYGRYWGALERVDCLHFEACYYQPLQWCIANAYQRFEGGAQGEHKMARALMPVKTTSAHWLAEPAFARAVEDFLVREDRGIDSYLVELAQRNPFRRAL